MCGIAGFISRDSDPVNESVLDKMMNRISHRGPDGAGKWYNPAFSAWRVHLGHRRLSIIDLESGAQPMSNEDGKVQIVFNGEIYNFKELTDSLTSKGHRFATRSDTEAIIHQYEEFGTEGFNALNGMFAFGIWDQTRQQMVLARDRAGIKPLYYATTKQGELVFASELTALLSHPRIQRKISRSALSAYFFLDYIQAPLTLIEGVFKLQPGHFLLWREGQITQPEPFWKLESVQEQCLDQDVNTLAEQTRARFSEAVRRQMIADVPIGIFLSGGIDSSAVAALAQKHTSVPIRTFSIGFEDPSYDESGFARAVAKHIGSSHTEEILSEAMVLDATIQALQMLDEPMADPSFIPTFLLSRLTSQHVKVALGGDAGDELWAGYPTYLAHQYGSYYARIPQCVRDHLISPTVSKLPIDDRYQSFEWKAKRFTQRWDENYLRRHQRWMSNTDLPDLPSIIPEFCLSELSYVFFDVPFFTDKLNSLMALDFQTYLPGSVLAKVDRASMANSLETRPPFLDNDMIEWAFSLPSHLKLRKQSGKYLLKLAVRDLLPESIIHRKKKGFGIPLSHWLKAPMRPILEKTLASSPLWESRSGSMPLLDRGCFKNWANEHFEGRRDRSKTLWALIVLDQWVKREVSNG